MRKPLFVAGVTCFFLAAVLLIVSISLYLPLELESLDITGTYSGAVDTQVARVLGTGYSFSEIERAISTMALTRTAVALTHNPSLATSPTPIPIKLTAFQIVALTASVFAQFGPQTTLTPPPTTTTWPCAPQIQTDYHVDLTARIEASLIEEGLYPFDVHIASDGLGQPENCGTSFYPFHTEFFIEVEVKHISNFLDDVVLADSTNAILGILSTSLTQEEVGPEPSRLYMIFRLSNDARRVVETDYSIALAAYNEGLRGEALLEALGGILPG